MSYIRQLSLLGPTERFLRHFQILIIMNLLFPNHFTISIPTQSRFLNLIHYEDAADLAIALVSNQQNILRRRETG